MALNDLKPLRLLAAKLLLGYRETTVERVSYGHSSALFARACVVLLEIALETVVLEQHCLETCAANCDMVQNQAEKMVTVLETSKMDSVVLSLLVIIVKRLNSMQIATTISTRMPMLTLNLNAFAIVFAERLVALHRLYHKNVYASIAMLQCQKFDHTLYT